MKNGIEEALTIYPELTPFRHVLEEIVVCMTDIDDFTRDVRDRERRLEELDGELVSLVEQSQGSQAQEAAA